jgi:hypothetical protein
MPVSPKLEKALRKALKPGVNLCKELENYSPDEIESVEDAAAICEALKRVNEYERACPESVEKYQSPLRDLAMLLHFPGNGDVTDVFRNTGIPQLISQYDSRIEKAMSREKEELLIVLIILAMYESTQGMARIVDAARRGFYSDSFLWQLIFEQVHDDHPGVEFLARELRDHLPAGYCGVTFLDCMNAAVIAGKLKSHPFESKEGKCRLEGWLLSRDESEFSHAHSATASLPFISNPERDRLLAIAMDHPDQSVQMKAAWASAKLGSESSLKFLARLCLDPNASQSACRYLAELNQEDVIPPEVNDEDFQAKAEMCSWLAHPSEFGRPPMEIELADTRELYWPPTDDTRRVWVFKYRYPADEVGKEDDVGCGMVGSVTFALFGETTADLSPEDVYALHCAWELECNKDGRAPKKRTAKAGRRILAAYNDDFPGETDNA